MSQDILLELLPYLYLITPSSSSQFEPVQPTTIPTLKKRKKPSIHVTAEESEPENTETMDLQVSYGDFTTIGIQFNLKYRLDERFPSRSTTNI